jgi:hypothetical protein
VMQIAAFALLVAGGALFTDPRAGGPRARQP